jgi:hypothetical protein
MSRTLQKSTLIILLKYSGYQFTQKLEGMFNDMRLSTDMMKGYQKSVAGKTDVSPRRDMQTRTIQLIPVS